MIFYNNLCEREVVVITCTLKEKMSLNYEDVTSEWLKEAKPNNGRVINREFFADKYNNKYFVDNKNVLFDPSIKEIEVARWINRIFGDNIYLNPRIVYPKHIKTSDYLWKNENWDLKELDEKATSRKRAVDNLIKSSKLQTSNIILDITKSKLGHFNILQQVEYLYLKKDREWLDKIMIIDNYKLIKVYKRKQSG